jgi:hypothetical protein
MRRMDFTVSDVLFLADILHLNSSRPDFAMISYIVCNLPWMLGGVLYSTSPSAKKLRYINSMTIPVSKPGDLMIFCRKWVSGTSV